MTERPSKGHDTECIGIARQSHRTPNSAARKTQSRTCKLRAETGATTNRLPSAERLTNGSPFTDCLMNQAAFSMRSCGCAINKGKKRQPHERELKLAVGKKAPCPFRHSRACPIWAQPATNRKVRSKSLHMPKSRVRKQRSNAALHGKLGAHGQRTGLLRHRSQASLCVAARMLSAARMWTKVAERAIAGPPATCTRRARHRERRGRANGAKRRKEARAQIGLSRDEGAPGKHFSRQSLPPTYISCNERAFGCAARCCAVHWRLLWRSRPSTMCSSAAAVRL